MSFVNQNNSLILSFILMQANATLKTMENLKNFVKALDKSLGLLRVEGEFKNEFMKFVDLAHTPFVIAILESINVDIKVVDMVFDALLHDKQVKDITGTIGNIFECFSVDRFIGVESEKKLEDLAVELNEKKLFLAGIAFDNGGQGSGPNETDHAYTLRMDIDNTPVTLENRNRLWFPGADSSFELQMRYHRGFIQIQHMIDRAITKTLVDSQNDQLERIWESTTTVAPPSPPTTTSIWGVDDDYEDEENGAGVTDATGTDVTLSPVETETTVSPETAGTEDEQTTIPPNVPIEATNSTPTVVIRLKSANMTIRDEKPQETLDADIDSDKSDKRRKKRSPQFSFLDLFSGGGNEKMEDTFTGGIKLPDHEVYTKQFPYPKYRKDNFVTGLYLAQSIQLAFFFALIIQVSSAVRYRIWMRESGNSTVSLCISIWRKL